MQSYSGKKHPMKFSGVLCETGELATVTVNGPTIESITPGLSPDAIGGPDVLISPGFFDLQVNGYGGYDFNLGIWESRDEATDKFLPLYGLLAKAGTALVLPTVVTNSFELMAASLRAIDSVLEKHADLECRTPGIHVEGPYFSSEDGPRGAHPLAHIRDPDYEEFQRFQDEAGGRILLFTMAPERPGALKFIDTVTSDGVIVAIGHTGASPETIRDAVSAGATLSTHLGNGAHSVLPR